MQRVALRTPAVLLTAVAIVAGSAPAWAATLGGLTANSLTVWQQSAGAVAPAVVGWTSFTFPNNTKLDGTSLDGGGTWIAQFGTWKATSGHATSNNAGFSNLTTSVGTADAAVEAQIDPSGSPHAGLVAMSDGTSFVFAEFEKASGGRIRVFEYADGTVSQLAEVTGIGTPVVARMRLDTTTDVVEVSWNGVVVLSPTLTATEAARFKSSGHTRFGLIANNDPGTTFDDVHVDV